MCLAVYKPKNATLSKNHLKNGFSANSDGAGFSVALNGELKIFKGFFSFDEFYTAFKPYNRAGVPALVHFRFATHGKVIVENCHPFAVSDAISAVHNGVLDWRSTDLESDTACFIADNLRPFGHYGINFFDTPAFRGMIEKIIGASNKIALLDKSGKAIIYNEAKGGAHWKYGAWWSNYGYEYAPYKPLVPAYSHGFGARGWQPYDPESDDVLGTDFIDPVEVLCVDCFKTLDDNQRLEGIPIEDCFEDVCAICYADLLPAPKTAES